MELALFLCALPLLVLGLSGGDDEEEETAEDSPDIIGTEGADTLHDDSGADLQVLALGGGDDIVTGAGDDAIDAGAGDDFAFGGDGADTLLGESGNDDLRGEAGQDSLVGGTGHDTLSGYTGADTLLGGAGRDSLDGDAIYAGTGETGAELSADYLDGGAGDDVLIGGDYAQSIPADAPVDTLIGGSGDDLILDSHAILHDEYSSRSIPDADALIDAGPGEDTIVVSGGDTITTGAGADLIWLGSVPTGVPDGSERVLVAQSHLTVTDFTPGEDRLDITLVTSVEGADVQQGYLALHEADGNTVLSFTEAETGVVSEAVVTLLGVTGLQLEDILADPQSGLRAGAGGDDTGHDSRADAVGAVLASAGADLGAMRAADDAMRAGPCLG